MCDARLSVGSLAAEGRRRLGRMRRAHCHDRGAPRGNRSHPTDMQSSISAAHHNCQGMAARIRHEARALRIVLRVPLRVCTHLLSSQVPLPERSGCGPRIARQCSGYEASSARCHELAPVIRDFLCLGLGHLSRLTQLQAELRPERLNLRHGVPASPLSCLALRLEGE